MDRFLTGFIIASISSLAWPGLPTWIWLVWLFLFILIAYRFRYYFIAGLLFGILWMASVGHSVLFWQLPETIFSHPVTLKGKVISAVSSQSQVRFDFSISAVDGRPFRCHSNKVRLSWHEPPFIIGQGQEIEVTVKLKPPYGLSNIGGFNYQKWLFANSILATGYVKADPGNQILRADISYRQRLLNKLLLYEVPGIEWLAAMALGYRGKLSDQDWLILKSTGTSHLVAISGLHLLMVAGLCFLLSKTLLLPIVAVATDLNYVPLNRYAMALGAFACGCFAWLAGMSLPTLRALIMLLLLMVLKQFRFNWNLGRFFLVCVALFILLFPLSLLTMSFWLSFGAVCCLLFINWRWPNSQTSGGILGDWLRFFKLQWLLSLLMLPLVVAFFSGVSLLAPLVNLVAVPLVTLCLLPLALFAIAAMAISPDFALPVIKTVAWLFDMASGALSWVASQPYAWLDLGFELNSIAIFVLLLLCLTLLPKLPFNRSYLIFLVLPIALQIMPQRPQHWETHILDVGQGLAIVVIKDNRAILYDTGAAYRTGFNMVEAAILPFLRSRKITALDLVVLSHDDNDHSGGAHILDSQIEVKDWKISPGNCEQGEQLNWLGLSLAVLWPPSGAVGTDNNLSCVIKVKGAGGSVLLTGDIERSVETKLVGLHQQGLINVSAEILVAPHHGSNTSSSSAFIGAVNPEVAVFSQGFRNRWRLPHAKVQARYNELGITTYRTSESGQLSLYFLENKPIRLQRHRQDIAKFWYLPARDD